MVGQGSWQLLVFNNGAMVMRVGGAFTAFRTTFSAMLLVARLVSSNLHSITVSSLCV